MKIYLAAGEESGDLHGGRLAEALKGLAPGVELAGMAGARMRDAGVEALVATEGHGVVGFIEVLGRLRRFRRDLDVLARAMARDGDALVAVDYGGFNARLVARAKRAGLKTFYYIPPKLWAWGRHRGKRLARNLDLVLAVFPFEVDYWREAGASVAFVGHPLLDVTRPSGRDVRAALGLREGEKLLLVLPGSRRQEVAALWPPVAEALSAITAQLPEVRPFVAPARSLGVDILREYGPLPEGASATDEPVVDLMAAADAAVAASGTASLELAIVGTPAVILYKVNYFTWELGRRLVYVEHLGLPNIIARRPIVAELLQGDVEPDLIAYETARLFRDESLRRRIVTDYAAIREALRPPPALARDGLGAADCAARLIVEAIA
ncbi:MAG: lipid-A-disaccharide synthase [candidate division Zixibacteria bacterium]|nr:lipid-A-disaccharide synthase [candidate division Zixibacteria bacterium]